MNLVERVTRRVKRRIVEDAEQDRLFRKQAREVYRKLVDYLRSGGDLMKFGRSVTIDMFTDYEQGVANPLKVQWKQKDKASSDAAYAKVDGQPTITLFVMDRAVYNERDRARKEMINKLQDNATVFMHEYIHYLDDRRTETYIDDLASYESGKNKKMSVYFSDDFEVNAYFQAGLAQTEELLEEPSLLQTFLKRWDRNFRKFKDWFFENQIPPRMDYNISDSQRKRLVNRLYGFWEEYIKPKIQK